MKLAFLYLIFLIGALLPTVTLAEKSNLLETVKNESDVEVIYNYINSIDWTTENLSIVKFLWKKDIKMYPDLPWGKLNNDIVRLALANILMQSSRQCKIKIDMDELHNFVKSKTMSENLDIRGRASLLLGLAGYDGDIPFLSSIVKSEQEGYAEEAALSLTYIHSHAAVSELRNLNKKVMRPSLKKLLQELVDEYQNLGLTECKK